MKKILFPVFALCVFTLPALAQEAVPAMSTDAALPVKQEVVPAPAPSLTHEPGANEQQALVRGVSYAHSEAEYSVGLPEAPLSTTIWADDFESVPYLPNPPSYGAIGETATLRRVTPATGDFFDVKITYLKAPKDFLQEQTKQKMLNVLEQEFSDIQLDKKETQFSAGSDTLKWATITGYSIDKENNLMFNAAHFLTGLHSLTVIRVTYSVNNKLFQSYYNMLSRTIRYTGQ